MFLRSYVSVFIVLAMLVGVVQGDPNCNSEITYSLTEIGGGVWEYEYTVANLGLPEGIDEFVVWFDYSLYDNLAITTYLPPALDWNETLTQPVASLSTVGSYDAMTQATPQRLWIGEEAGSFAVSFAWLGEGAPGPQFYEIIDPETSHAIDSGWTVPEPVSIGLLGLGAVALLRGKAHKRNN